MPDETGTAAVDEIARLWHSATQQRTRDDLRGSTTRKWTRFSPGHAVTRADYQMIDRCTLQQQLPGSSQPNRPNYLRKLKEFALGE